MKRVRTYRFVAAGAMAALTVGLLGGSGSAAAEDGFARWG